MPTVTDQNVVIVTSATTIIGKSITLHLLSKDISVIAISHNPTALKILTEEAARLTNSPKLTVIAGNDTSQSIQQQIVDAAANSGALVALVNNLTSSDGFPSEWTQLLARDIRDATGLTQKVLPLLIRAGGIVVDIL